MSFIRQYESRAARTRRPAFFAARSGLPLIAIGAAGLHQEIVDADTAVSGKPDEQFVRERLGPGLKIAVFSLCDTDRGGDLLLRQIMILAQIFDSVLHDNLALRRVKRLVYYTSDNSYLLAFR